MHALADNGELYGWGTYKEESGFMGFLNDSENPLKQNTPLRIAFFGDEDKGTLQFDSHLNNFGFSFLF